MQDKINSLRLKGFSDEEIAKALKLSLEEVSAVKREEDIVTNSISLYSDMQKDLSRLIMTEIGKDNRDTQVILNAIRLQSELQEKKLQLSRTGVGKVSKAYINKRDEEIANMLTEGLNEEEIAKKVGLSVLSIRLAKDRIDLNLPEHLTQLNPAIITETKSLNRNLRLQILEDALRLKQTRDEVRKVVMNIKNEMRCS